MSIEKKNILDLFQKCLIIDLDVSSGEQGKKRTSSDKYSESWYSFIPSDIRNMISSRRVKAYRAIELHVIKIRLTSKRTLYLVPLQNLEIIEEKLSQIRDEYFEIIEEQLIKKRDEINADIQNYLLKNSIATKPWHFLPAPQRLREKFRFSWSYTQLVFPAEYITSEIQRKAIYDRAKEEAEKISTEISIYLRSQLKKQFDDTLVLLRKNKSLRKDSLNKLERVLDSIASLNINNDSEIERFIEEVKTHISNAEALEVTLENLVSEINRELEQLSEESIFDEYKVPKNSKPESKLDNVIEESVF